MEISEFKPLQKRKVQKSSTTQRKSKLAVSSFENELQQKDTDVLKSEIDDECEKESTLYHKVHFENLDRVSFYIDGAIGLPANCTVTRVTARLLTQDRQQVTPLGSSESHSDPQSPCFSPSYELFLSWKAKDLDPSLTLLCRIDTLERYRLKPQTVGYAALKLCVLNSLTQPQPRDESPSFLNAGCFNLPIMLGAIPTWCPLTQESIEDLPVMPNASLIVRLFDASSDAPEKTILPHPGRDSKIHSVAEILYATYDNPVAARALSTRKSPPLPMQSAYGNTLAMGRPLDENDWQVLRPLLKKWMGAAFPPLNEMRHTLDVRYALRYAERDLESGSPGCEILAGADMLYNMPVPLSLKSRPILYKTRFAYLRAKRGQFPQNQGQQTCENPKYIMDDVSRFIDLDASTRQCPVYIDEFTTIGNMDLGARSCLLVLVHRVDIEFPTPNTFQIDMQIRDPDRSWWGILPLRMDSPFYAPEGSTVAETEFDGAFVNAGTHQVPLFQGLPPVEVTNSPNPYHTVLTKLRQNQPPELSGCFSCLGHMNADIGSLCEEFDLPVLSYCGASAIIRLVDSKMARFCSNHIKVDNQAPDTTLLREILGAEAGGGSSKNRLFDFQHLKYEFEPSISTILTSYLKEGGVKIVELVNAETQRCMQEYVNSLP